MKKPSAVRLVAFSMLITGLWWFSAAPLHAQAAFKDPACTPDAGFFTRMKCLWEIGTDAVGIFFTDQKNEALSPFPSKNADSLETFVKNLPTKDLVQAANSATKNTVNFIKNYERVAEEERESLLPLLAVKAEEREVFMEELAERDPAQFLANVLSEEELASFPVEIQSKLEKKGSITGEIEVLHADDFNNPENSEFKYYLEAGGTRYQLFPVGEAPSLISGARAQITGYTIGNNIVAKTTGTNFNVTSSPEPDSIGEQKTLVLLTRFLDSPPSPPFEANEIKEKIFNGQFQNFTKENSYGKAYWSGDAVGWITAPVNGCPGELGLEWDEDFKNIILQNNIDLENYGRVVLIEDDPCYSYGGYSSVGKWEINVGGVKRRLSLSSLGHPRDFNSPSNWGIQPFQWTNLDFLLSHELGHALGLPHSNLWFCEDGEIVYGSNCQSVEYGNNFDAMGNSSFSLHYNAYYKKVLEWLDTESILNITQSGRYTIPMLEDQKGGFKAAVVGPSQSLFYLEHRKGIGFDARLNEPDLASNQNGLFVNWVTRAPRANLLDLDKRENFWGQWGSVTLNEGKVFREVGHGFELRPVSVGVSGLTFDVDIFQPQCVRRKPAIVPHVLQEEVFIGGHRYVGIDIKNQDGVACEDSSFFLEILDLPPRWPVSLFRNELTISSSTPFSLKVQESSSLFLVVSPPEDESAGTYSFRVRVVNKSDGKLVSNWLKLSLKVKIPIVASWDVSPSLPKGIPLGGKEASLFDLKFQGGSESVSFDEIWISGIGNYATWGDQLENISIHEGAAFLGGLDLNNDSEVFGSLKKISLNAPVVLPPESEKILRFRGDISPSARGSIGLAFLGIFKEGRDIYVRGLPVYGNSRRILKPIDIPQNLSAGSMSPISFAQLSWQDTSAAEDGFEIWRGDKAGEEKFLATVRQNTIEFTDTAGEANKTYHYRVRAFQIDDECVFSILKIKIGCRDSKKYSDFSEPASVSIVSGLGKIAPGDEVTIPRTGFESATIGADIDETAPAPAPSRITTDSLIFGIPDDAPASYHIDTSLIEDAVRVIKRFQVTE